MAYKRKRTTRRSARRVKRKVARIPRSINLGASFTRSWFEGNWVFDTAATSGFWRTIRPTFGDVPNWTEYRNLFDMYKVHSIKVTIHPRYLYATQPANSATGPATNQMYLTYVTDTDHDFSYVPTGIYSSGTYNTLLEKAGSRCKTVALNKPRSFTFTPKIVEDFGGAFHMAKMPWMNTQTFSTLYGAHLFMHDYAFSALNGGDFGVDIQYTFKFSMKGQN